MSFRELLAALNANRFETAAVILFVIGMAGMLFNNNLVKKIVSMGFMDSAIYLFLTSDGYVAGHLAPIITDPAVSAGADVYANPLPAGLVLTGIVVSVSFTAFSLALTKRLFRRYHSLNVDEILQQARKSED